MRQQIVRSLLASILLMQSTLPSALAQPGEGQTTSDSLTAAKTVVGSGDAQPEDISSSEAGHAPSEHGHRRPAPPAAPAPPRSRHPRPSGNSGTWQPRNGRHALIGALIGFGIGAALGAKGNKDQHMRARVAGPILVGGVGAMIGAAVGGSHP